MTEQFVKYRLLNTGYCMASEHHAISGGRKEPIRFYATMGVIHHPIEGYILFDTGYTDRFYSATRNLPYLLYAKATKVYHNKDQSVIVQLDELGISPSEIKTIIISHFHADHIGGLLDFPGAKLVCSKLAYNDIKNKKGISAVKKGFLPQLMPTDFANRVKWAGFSDTKVKHPILGETVDLFQDGSIQLCQLNGHAIGQIGAIITTSTSKIFLCSDAAWLKQNYQENRLPHSIVRLFFGNWKAYIASLNRLHTYYTTNPNHLIIPCHCTATMESVIEKQGHGFI